MTDLVSLYNNISLIGFVLAGVMLILSTLLFLKFNIPKLMGDLSGATARKAINDLKESNLKAIEKNTGKIQLVKENSEMPSAPAGNITVNPGYNGQTPVYAQQSYVQPGSSNETAKLSPAPNETVKLSPEDYAPGETSVLQVPDAIEEITNYNFNILYEKILINTTEVI